MRIAGADGHQVLRGFGLSPQAPDDDRLTERRFLIGTHEGVIDLYPIIAQTPVEITGKNLAGRAAMQKLMFMSIRFSCMNV